MPCPSTPSRLAAQLLQPGKARFSAASLSNIWLCACQSLISRGKGTVCIQNCEKSPPCHLQYDCTWNSKAQVKDSAEMSAHIRWCKSQHWYRSQNPQTSSSEKRPSLPLIAQVGSFASRGSAVQWWKQGTYFGKKQPLPQAKGGCVHATHLPLQGLSELMSPGRDGRASWGKHGHPPQLFALVSPTSPTYKAPGAALECDKGKGSDESLDLCKSDVRPVAHWACLQPLPPEALELQHLETFAIKPRGWWKGH